MADLGDLGGSDLARTGILVENRGIDGAKAELLELADAADRATKRAGDAASRAAEAAIKGAQESAAAAQRFATSEAAAIVDRGMAAAEQARQTAAAKAERQAAENARREATAYTTTLQQEYASALATIHEALARGFITVDEARNAGRAAALAYNQEVLAAIDRGQMAGAFAGPKGDAAYTQLAGSLKVVQSESDALTASLQRQAAVEAQARSEDERRAAALRQMAGAEQAAYLEEERRQAAVRALAASEQAAYAEEQRRAQGIRQLALAQAEAIAIDEAAARGNRAALAITSNSVTALGEASAKSGVSINTIRAGLTGLLASSLQTAPGVAQLGSAVGALALGTATTVGVLAGVAAITSVYHALTDDAKKAREEQDKYVESLDRWYERQRAGSNAELDKQIIAQTQHLKDLRATLSDLENRTTFANFSQFGTAILKGIADSITSFNPRTIADAFERRWNEVVDRQKAAIEKGAAELRAATRQAYQNIQTDLASDLTTQGGNFATLIGAGAASGVQGREAAGLLRELRLNLRELQQEYGNTKDASDRAFNLQLQTQYLAGIRQLEDGFREGLLRPLNDAIKETELYTKAIFDEIAAHEGVLKALDKQTDALAKQKPYLIGEQQLLAQIAAANKIIADLPAPKVAGDVYGPLADDLQKRLQPLRELANGLQRDFTRAISQGLKDGFGSVDSILSAFGNTINDFASRRISQVATDRFKQLSVPDQEALSNFAVAATAANSLANALNQLTGVVHQTAAQIEQDTENRVKFRIAFQDYQTSAIGNPTEQALARITQQANDLRAQAEQAFGGKRFEDERNKQLAAIAAVERQQIERLATDFTGKITEELNALGGTAGAYANQLAALKKEYDENLAAATALGTGLDDVKKLYEAQVAAAKAAYEEGQRQLTLSLDAREAYARGLSAEGDAIARHAAQEKEYFDAQQAGYTDAQLARLAYVQGLEEEAAALQAAIAVVNQSVSDIQRDVSLGFTGGKEGLAAEQNAFGFGGLTIDDIRSRYTTFAGTPLTPEQEETNRRIQQFLQDYDKVFGTLNGLPKAIEDAVTSGASDAVTRARTSTASDAVSYAARNLSEVTGNRMTDILSASYVVQREQFEFLKSTFAGGQAARIVAQQQAFYNGLSATPLPNFSSAPTAAPTASAMRIVVPAPASESGPLRVEIIHRVVGGTIDLSAIDDQIEVLAEKLEDAIIRRAAKQRLADGSPLLAGR